MKNLKTKTIAILISALMIIAIGTSTALIQNAHAVTNVQTFGFINVAPNPCGVGQSVTIDFWLSVPLQDSEFAVAMTIKVGLPDGTSTTLGPYVSDRTGGTTTQYVPESTGNYTFQFIYGGQTLTATTGPYVGFYEEPCQSGVATLTVQSTPAQAYMFTPLPTQYWQTPVNAENTQNWAAIVGPWLGFAANTFAATGAYNATGSYNPYTLGPTTGHILWTKPWAFGGAVGGDVGGTEQYSDYWSTSQYEPKWAPVVINGFEYSTWYPGSTADSAGIQCINLYNGQTQFIINTTNALRCGQTLNYVSINQFGTIAYLWTTGPLPNVVSTGTEWNMYDAMTGTYILSIVNGTALTLTTDSTGNLYGYYVNTTAGTEIVHPDDLPAAVQTNTGPTLNCWNSTLAFAGQLTSQLSPPLGGVYRFELGLMWSAPIYTSIGGNPVGTEQAQTLVKIVSGVALIMTDSDNGAGGEVITGGFGEAGYSLATGALLWGPVNRTASNGVLVPYTRIGIFAVSGVYTEYNEVTQVMDGYSLQTGTLLWTTTLTTANGGAPNTYDEYGVTGIGDSTNGILYLWGLGGDVWALDSSTGKVLWYTNTETLVGGSGTETPYGIWPLWVFNVGCIAGTGTNTILYTAIGHEYSPPLFHGADQLAINATNGQLIWSQLAFDVTGTEVSYGVMTSLNAYDNQVYAYGQGPSQTTVTAPDPVGTVGSPMVISGTVMDISAGATQEAVAANFPNGLPAVSDASMAQFMEYVYEQQPHPSNTTGVPVTLTAIDPNGNTVTLGATTTDASGTYSVTWTPPIPGNYTVLATFAGSGGYYGSYGETHVYASSAHPTEMPTSTPVGNIATTSDLMLGIAVAVIAIIIAIAIVGLLILRKKP